MRKVDKSGALAVMKFWLAVAAFVGVLFVFAWVVSLYPSLALIIPGTAFFILFSYLIYDVNRSR